MHASPSPMNSVRVIESLAIYVLVIVLIVLFRNPLLEYILK